MELTRICQEILDDIITPTCEILDIKADYWLSDVETFTMDNSEARDKVFTQIAEKYRLTEDQMIYLDSFTPLIQMALFIYLQDMDEPADI